MSAVMEIHPIAEIFPLLVGDEFNAFKSDIAERGLIEAIWTYEGKILDGRNRYRACVEIGIEPSFREYIGESAVEFAWSLNARRRQLTKSQLAIIAVKMLPALHEEAKKRQLANLKIGNKFPVVPEPVQREMNRDNEVNGSPIKEGKAIKQAAAIVGAGKTQIQYAKAVAKRCPELVAEIESGKISVDRAWLICTGQSVPDKYAGVRQHVPREKRAVDIQRLATEGHLAQQIADELGVGEQQVRKIARDVGITLPDAALGKTRRTINVRMVIEQTVIGLSGYAMGLGMINGAIKSIEASDAKEWAASIAESIKPITQLRKQLLEIANG